MKNVILVLLLLCIYSCGNNVQKTDNENSVSEQVAAQTSPAVSGGGSLVVTSTAAATGTVGFSAITLSFVSSTYLTSDFKIESRRTGQQGDTAVNVTYFCPTCTGTTLDAGTSTLSLSLPDSVKNVPASILTGSVIVLSKSGGTLVTGSMTYPTTVKLPVIPPHHN